MAWCRQPAGEVRVELISSTPGQNSLVRSILLTPLREVGLGAATDPKLPLAVGSYRSKAALRRRHF